MKFLFTEIRQKPIEYLVLAAIVIISIVLFIVFRFDGHWQRRIVYAASAAYFLWSLYHHYRRGDLEISIVIEYLVFILLALIVATVTLL